MRAKPKSSATSRSARPAGSVAATTRRPPARRADIPINRHGADDTGEENIDAAVQRLIGIAPQDGLESMMAAQLIAGHRAAMACYRDAANERSFERRRACLNQATRLTRAVLALVNALQRRSNVWARPRPRPADDTKSEKQPSGVPSVPAATSAPASAQAKSAKQPSAGLPPTPAPTPAAASWLAPAQPGDPSKSAKQPSPMTPAPALGPRPHAVMYRTPGASRALAAALMGTTR